MTGQLTNDRTPRELLVSMDPIDTASCERNAGPLKSFASEELAMLEFARRWAPFGGVKPGDVLVEFGITRPQFYARVEKLLVRARVH